MTEVPQGKLDPVAIRRACEELLQLHQSQEVMTVAASDSMMAQVLHGLCQQALNHSRAAWAVIDAGFPVEASANIRTALEHAVTAQWAFLTPNGVGHLVDGAKFKASQYFDSAGLQVELGPAAKNQIAEWKSHRQLPSFSAICDELDGTHNPDVPRSGLLRFEYVRLSQAIHVTSSTISGYLHVDELTGQAALRQQALERFPEANILDLGMATAMACWIVESIRAEPNRLADVERIADAANIPSTLAQDYQEASEKKRSKSKVQSPTRGMKRGER
ncbi:hypothetical protein [Pseudarthrobacter sulfonivorans]|uniref:hypothetical protein n=1 Tax=Pseudarthrobacter sulfonivorans TaxID=121292 RepID=UPI002857CF3B|nr:hypothetical protein [Pseudarthrobacter sulfonivorans]MDR6417562.1 hypothetical protein [Pseudarthrobacter sulfonivorans]